MRKKLRLVSNEEPDKYKCQVCGKNISWKKLTFHCGRCGGSGTWVPDGCLLILDGDGHERLEKDGR